MEDINKKVNYNQESLIGWIDRMQVFLIGYLDLFAILILISLYIKSVHEERKLLFTI
jgi:hypothetical protein